MLLSTKARVLTELHRYEDALLTANKVLELQPNFSTKDKVFILHKLAVDLCKQGNCEGALVKLDEALALNKNDDDYLILLLTKARVLNELRRYEDALLTVNKALELNPNSTQSIKAKSLVLYELAVALYKQGNYEGALVKLDEALELNPNFLQAIESKVQVFIALDRYEDALLTVNKAELNPNSKEALEAQVKLLELNKPVQVDLVPTTSGQESTPPVEHSTQKPGGENPQATDEL